MKPAAPAPRLRPNGKTLCALSAIVAGLVVGNGTEERTFPQSISIPK